MARDKKPLNISQEVFAQQVAAGKTLAAAYVAAHPAADKWKRPVLYARASELSRLETVKARILELIAGAEKRSKLTRDRVIEVLADIMEGRREGSTVRDAIAAAERIAKMMGWDQPTKLEHSGNMGVTLYDISDIRREDAEAEAEEGQ